MDVSDIFIFSARGRGRQSPRRREGGVGGPICAIDWQIRANRPILANRFRVPELNPFVGKSRFGGLQTANHRFEGIRANRSHIVKIGFFFLRIDSRESPRFALRIAGPSKIPCTRLRFGGAEGMSVEIMKRCSGKKKTT